jgi:hypothetical protein
MSWWWLIYFRYPCCSAKYEYDHEWFSYNCYHSILVLRNSCLGYNVIHSLFPLSYLSFINCMFFPSILLSRQIISMPPRMYLPLISTLPFYLCAIHFLFHDNHLLRLCINILTWPRIWFLVHSLGTNLQNRTHYRYCFLSQTQLD